MRNVWKVILFSYLNYITWINHFHLSHVFYYRWRKAWYFPSQDSSQGRARLTDWLTVWLTRTTEAGVSRADELPGSLLIILARVSIWVSQKERETEGVWTDLLHHASPPNETVTAPSCPSAIQKHLCPFSHMTPAAQSRFGVMARNVRVIVWWDTHKSRWPQQKIYLALTISVCSLCKVYLSENKSCWQNKKGVLEVQLSIFILILNVI